MTDRKTRVAEVRLESGHTFAILRQTSGQVWAVLALPNGKFDIFGDRRIQYRIDSLPAEDLEKSRQIEKLLRSPMYVHEPTTASWVIWNGEGQADQGTLRQLMDGGSLLIRYFKFPEGSAELRFPLDGAKAAIADALRINQDADKNAAAATAARNDALISTSRRCMESHRGDRQGFSKCVSEARATNPTSK
jgi:hypothetical protein